MRKAIATAEVVAPCVLWVDEIEKGFTSLKSDGDSGTSARVFGTFLTWMQEKTAPVFVIATANDISALPPELLRKGRFDEIFFTDLPTRSERAKIFDLHIRKRTENSEIAHNIQITPECCYELADLTKGYVGAEIEQIVIAAMYEAFYNGIGLEKEDLIKCASGKLCYCQQHKKSRFCHCVNGQRNMLFWQLHLKIGNNQLIMIIILISVNAKAAESLTLNN